MKRRVYISVMAGTWPKSRPIPPELLALQGPIPLNMLNALVHTALWTRPPTLRGFHLSDYWAWLRYGRAFASTYSLRLCEEWEDLDPHQKTLLSDEVGVGVTTCLLAQHLGIRKFVDTLYVLRSLLPDQFSLGRTSKVGPRKSPDFIAIDNAGRFVVLECKGTQSSRNTLHASIKNGVPQKKNLRPKRGTKIHMSLVAGLFLPQWRNKERATVMFADPSWEELSDALALLDPQDVFTAVEQIHTAQMLALAGRSTVAGELAGTPLEELRTLSDNAKRDLGQLADRQIVDIVVLDTTILPTSMNLPRAIFHLYLPHSLIHSLLESKDLRDTLRELGQEGVERSWVHESAEPTFVYITMPNGCRIRFEYFDSSLPQNLSAEDDDE